MSLSARSGKVIFISAQRSAHSTEIRRGGKYDAVPISHNFGTSRVLVLGVVGWISEIVLMVMYREWTSVASSLYTQSDVNFLFVMLLQLASQYFIKKICKAAVSHFRNSDYFQVFLPHLPKLKQVVPERMLLAKSHLLRSYWMTSFIESSDVTETNMIPGAHISVVYIISGRGIFHNVTEISLKDHLKG